MHACIRKVRWFSIRDRVLSGRGEFKPDEILPAAIGAVSPYGKIGEEVTMILKQILSRSV